MSDKFGASHRELVRDTNAGNVAPPPDTELKTSVQTGGRRTTEITNSRKSELHQGLLDLGTKVLGNVKERQEEIDFQEGYTRGLEKGFIESQTSPLRDMLFGKSATLRGAQKVFVENDSAQFLNTEMTDLENTMKTKDSKQYREYLSEKVLASAADHDDPEFKAQIMASATKHMEQLSRVHAKARQDWIDQENESAISDRMALSILTMRNNQEYGDEESQLAAQEAAQEAFTKPEGMNQDAFNNSVTNNIVSALTRGENLTLKLAESNNILEALSPTEQLKIQTANGIYQRKNGRDFQRDKTAMTGRIASGQASHDEIRALVAKYPDAGITVNSLMDIKAKYDAERNVVNKSQAAADDSFVSGDVSWNSASKVEQRKSVQNTFNSMADKGIMKERQSLIDAGQFEGDPAATPTTQERVDYMLDNPYFFASTAAQHPDHKYAVVTNMGTSMLTDLRNENLDADGVDVLKKKMNFMEQFKQQLGNNFTKQFRSTEDAAEYAAYSGLVNEAGFNPTDVIRDMRRVADAPEIELDSINESIDDTAEEVGDEFLDSNPESQGAWGLYNKTPDNEQVFDAEMREQVAKYAKVYKGDMTKAKYAAAAVIRRRGVVSNGQFIMNGAQIGIKGGTIEEFTRGLNADDTFKARVVGLGKGFAIDADYTDMEITVDPFNKNNLVLHSIHESTGAPITLRIPAPQQGSDFGTYGLNSFTGYNPHIVNKDERRKAMLRDNLLNKGYTTISKAINKFTPELMQANANAGQAVLDANQSAGQSIVDTITSAFSGGQEVQPEAAAQPVSSEVETILKHEGGLSLNKNDPGNFNADGVIVGTNYGVSAPLLEKVRGHTVSKEEMANLTKEEAAKIHQDNLDAVKTEGVSKESTTIVNNMKTMTSGRNVRKVLKAAGKNASPEKIWKHYKPFLQKLRYPSKLPNGKPHPKAKQLMWPDFGVGWTRRYEEIVNQK